MIIDEDFQSWPATEGVVSDPPADCEATPNIPGPDFYELTYETGGTGQMKLIQYFISPECNTKRVNQGETAENAPGVTTGFISLRKTIEETDTIGEMWLPKLSNVTEIEFAFSCTSSDRGVRVYTSIDDGVTWEGPWTEDGPGDVEIIGADTKLGVVYWIPIERDNVIIKFTSGVDYDGVSQYTRIHNILVTGVPGGPETGIGTHSKNSLDAFYVPGRGLVIKGPAIGASVFDVTGKLVARSGEAGDQVMDLSGEPEGTYIVSVRNTAGETFRKKFVKQ